MTRAINAFGGDGAHEIHFQTVEGEQSVSLKRDLWFDRNDDQSWIVWAQHRSWNTDAPPAEDDPEAATLGAIVVTHPAVMAFIDQLGELLVNPARFRHEPEFAEDPARSDTNG